MKLKNWRYQREPRLMVIPMIDIIFFLLVFFMLNTMYMVEQNVLAVQLPKASHAEQQPAKQIAVTVSKEGEIWINKTKIRPQDFRGHVQTQLQESPEAIFVLRADSVVPHGQVIEVMDELRGLGVTKISVATERQGS